jgi:hypothetical protein
MMCKRLKTKTSTEVFLECARSGKEKGLIRDSVWMNAGLMNDGHGKSVSYTTLSL